MQQRTKQRCKELASLGSLWTQHSVKLLLSLSMSIRFRAYIFHAWVHLSCSCRSARCVHTAAHTSVWFSWMLFLLVSFMVKWLDVLVRKRGHFFFQGYGTKSLNALSVCHCHVSLDPWMLVLNVKYLISVQLVYSYWPHEAANSSWFITAGNTIEICVCVCSELYCGLTQQ